MTSSPRSPSENLEGIETDDRAKRVLPVVFTTILIDFAGFSVLIPVLPYYANRLGASAFEIGLILTLYALAQLLFLPAWGWCSDRFGRRPVILVSLLGTVFAYGLLTQADSLGGIYLSRILAGFFAASIGTAQAAVTDITSPSDRARGMGQIGAAIGLALVLGPALGGVLGSFDQQLPFYAVGAVAAVNFVVAWLRLPETRPDFDHLPTWGDLGRSLIPAPLRLASGVHDRRIALYLYLFFHVILGFSALESVFPKFLDDGFAADELQIGILFAWLGVFMIITQGFLIGRLTQLFRESTLVIFGLITCGAALASISLVPSMAGFYVIAPLIAVGYGVAYPTFTSLFSQACEAREAGELMGQSQSMATLGRVVGPMWAGLVMDNFSPGLTFVISGGLIFLGLIIFLAFRSTLVGEHG